ncbi:MAG: DNA-binding protein [Oscillospiraceae bacterium]|nr:DNA-binding protein [Oscillospiraceae bacterium]
MAVNPDITVLLDTYGAILTEKERDALDYYYNEDLSLKEIADNEELARRVRRESGYGDVDNIESLTISRQGVRDTIKRAEKKLTDIDAKLRLVERAAERNILLDLMIEAAEGIENYNRKNGVHRDITRLVDSITDTAKELYD